MCVRVCVCVCRQRRVKKGIVTGREEMTVCVFRQRRLEKGIVTGREEMNIRGVISQGFR